MSPSDSFPVSEAEAEGTRQLLVRDKQGGIVGQSRSRFFLLSAFQHAAFEKCCCGDGDTVVPEFMYVCVRVCGWVGV